MKFNGGAGELSHLAAIVVQLVIAFAVGQVKFFHADKFGLELFYLLDCEMGESGMRFATEHLADKKREFAAVGEHGLVHDLNWQSVAQLAAGDGAILVATGIEPPRFVGLILRGCGAKTSVVTVGEHPDDFGVGWRAFDPTLLEAVAENVCLEFHRRVSQ